MKSAKGKPRLTSQKCKETTTHCPLRPSARAEPTKTCRENQDGGTSWRRDSNSAEDTGARPYTTSNTEGSTPPRASQRSVPHPPLAERTDADLRQGRPASNPSSRLANPIRIPPHTVADHHHAIHAVHPPRALYTLLEGHHGEELDKRDASTHPPSPRRP
ncbi:hypothetical protein DFH09DRAFT_1367581 [Mycena vulgaris]|nr:hypothetical protein DFH09DRAFT_1367581 [Mycena vulgaris]